MSEFVGVPDEYLVLVDGICEGLGPFEYVRGACMAYCGGVFLRVAWGFVWVWEVGGGPWCCSIEDPGCVDGARGELVRLGVGCVEAG